LKLHGAGGPKGLGEMLSSASPCLRGGRIWIRIMPKHFRGLTCSSMGHIISRGVYVYDREHKRWLRERLEESHRSCCEQIERLRQSTFGQSQRETAGELTSYDNHPADLGTEMYERSRDVGLLTEALDELRDIEAALARLRSGEYGRCSMCGGLISFARMWAVPTTTMCEECISADRTT